MTKYWKQQELLMQTQITVTSTCIIRPCIKDLSKQNYQKKTIKKKKMLLAGGSENGTIILYQPIPSALL